MQENGRDRMTSSSSEAEGQPLSPVVFTAISFVTTRVRSKVVDKDDVVHELQVPHGLQNSCYLALKQEKAKGELEFNA